ncbi:MAG: hypothetical protein JSV12_01280 [Candidatus Bathyarchaeota archaeon]|nr:MAG: hypothetical protein JSV12_01280 [Candidatus Bathyarchaeota archaeon]
MKTNQSISSNEKALRNIAVGRKIYETTRYILVGNEKQGFAILEVKKEKIRKLYRRITSVKVLALGSESILIEDSNLDVLNPSQLVPLALQTYKKSGKKAVIVSGKYSHVNFVLIEGEPELDKIMIIDAIPPRPGKLISMVKDAMKVGLIDRAVDIEIREIDLIELARKAREKGAEVVIFPCESSSITAQSVDTEIFFLDREALPVFKSHKKLGLVGCDISLEALRHLLGRNFDRSRIIFEQMCPKQAVSNELPFMTKCCKLREGYEPVIEGKKMGVVVPWGARLREVADALNWLLHAIRKD